MYRVYVAGATPTDLALLCLKLLPLGSPVRAYRRKNKKEPRMPVLRNSSRVLKPANSGPEIAHTKAIINGHLQANII